MNGEESMNDAVVMEETAISSLEISAISDDELSAAFQSVVVEHKDVIASIHQSMQEADSAYRKYLDPAYEPMEQMAKADRAVLNKAEKNIQEKFAGLKAAYERPLLKIELNIKEIRNAIKRASGVVDGAVKSYEDTQKEKKYREIAAYFAEKRFDLVPLDKLFNERWLNKGYKLPDIKEDLDAAIAEIYTNIKVLENIAEYGTAAKAFYLDSLDMAAALRQIESLKANAEKLAREKIEREQREHESRINANAREERQEERHAETEKVVESMVNEALGIEEPEVAAPPELIEYTLRFKGTRENLEALKAWMTQHGISYVKVAV
jgi:hypothetical protein